MDNQQRWEQGRRATRRLWGDKIGSAVEDSIAAMSPGFADYVMGSGFAMYERPQLDYKTRSSLTIVMLAALGRSKELSLHIRGALNLGWTEEEIREMLMQVAMYAGVPAAVDAYEVANHTFEKLKAKKEGS